MVLQRNTSVKLWGWSGPNEKVIITTSWDNRTDSIIANGDAKWSLNIQTPGAGGPYSITFRGESTIGLNNVLLGEVWVCSGQSNMEWGGFKGLKEIAEACRAAPIKTSFFHVPKTTADYPQDDCSASWQESGPATLTISCYSIFWKTIVRNAECTCGLIHSSWGGNPPKHGLAGRVTGNEVLQKAALKIRGSTGGPQTGQGI